MNWRKESGNCMLACRAACLTLAGEPTILQESERFGIVCLVNRQRTCVAKAEVSGHSCQLLTARPSESASALDPLSEDRSSPH